MPVYNEEANITKVITEWMNAFSQQQVSSRMIAVNDGSTDTTLAALKKLQERFPDRLLIIDKPNSGHGQSCRTGYDAAVAQQPSWIFQIDSDGQCDPVFFSSFWAKRNEADCIFGFRVRRDDGALRLLVSKCASILTSILTGRDLKDANVPYRMVRRGALERALANVPKDFDIQNIALTLALKRDRTLRWAYVPIRFRARQGGSNSINLPKIAKMGLRMLSQIHNVGK